MWSWWDAYNGRKKKCDREEGDSIKQNKTLFGFDLAQQYQYEFVRRCLHIVAVSTRFTEKTEKQDSSAVISSKQLIDLNVRANTVQVLKQKHRRKFLWPWGQKRFLRIQRVLTIKEKIDQLDFTMLKPCFSKDTVETGDVQEMSIPPAQFCYELQTALKHRVYF